MEQNRELREAYVKSLNEMEDLKRFEGSTFGGFSRFFFEDRETISELTSKIQKPQNEVTSMNYSRVFKDIESTRSGQSHVTSQSAFLPHFRDLDGTRSRSVFWTRTIHQETFLQIQRRLLQHLIRKS